LIVKKTYHIYDLKPLGISKVICNFNQLKKNTFCSRNWLSQHVD